MEAKRLSHLEKFFLRLGFTIYAGHETREGWSGSLPFYFFFCRHCEEYVKDYVHGFDSYLNCPNCKT